MGRVPAAGLLSQLNNHLKVGDVFSFVTYVEAIGTNLRKGGKYAAILSLVYRVIEWGTLVSSVASWKVAERSAVVARSGRRMRSLAAALKCGSSKLTLGRLPWRQMVRSVWVVRLARFSQVRARHSVTASSI
jgi:hypothetical protein